MRWDDFYIEGFGSYLPQQREFATEMVAAGRYDEIEHQKTKQISAVVADPDRGETAPEMAVLAGRAALCDAGTDPGDIDLLVHAVVLHNGLEAWNCGSYIQDQLGIGDCIPIEIRTACAGGIVGMEMVGRWCAGKGKGVVTASDAWQLPMFDRWSSDSGLVYGDGAGAAVLGYDGGPFRIRSTSVVSDPALEQMHRGSEPTSMPQYGADSPIDLRARVAAFTATRDIDEFWTRNGAALSRCAETALADSGSEHSDISTWILPNFGSVLLRKQCLEPLKLHPEQTLAARGREIGHTGAADPFIGLDYMHRSGQLDAGDRLLLTGIGVGFTWGCAVVEYTGADDDKEDIRDGR
ncbi:3-oxoacyl-ACP synthase III family protein [Nocardia sp. CNY236]|uniref:3-oxoacyl-ACP synthase III family protein n=1 Tax=Nocardia sp. CNY236 TaxID=1169152 RepID=UPI00040ED9BE|nr:ketoacyl-ACP synthase III family protein [Nocardia sp. CNY236]